MIIGFIGLENSGKTTVFNALTGSEAQVTAYASQKTEPNLASVPVVDDRLLRLREMYNPKKTTFATVDIIDFVGLSAGAAKLGVFSSLTMGLVKNTDALALVLRNFEDETAGPPDPVADLEQIELELFLSDLIIAEKRLEKIESLYKKGQKTPALEFEEKVVRRIVDQLGDQQPIRDLGLNADEIKAVKSYHFLSQKPFFAILNSDENRFGRNAELFTGLSDRHEAIEFAGAFEMELIGLGEEDRQLFMADLGIEESARNRLIRMAYATLGYISFFTVGPDEVRAWTLKKGQSAVDAAGTIHNDLARGFIRAECFRYDELIEQGSEKGVKEKGLLRLEGKGYEVCDGDLLSIRFSV